MPSSIRFTNSESKLGIARIAIHQPRWRLPNEWYQSIMAKKFVKHTGIEARAIADLSESELAIKSIHALRQETGCELAQCAGLVFVSPSLVPMPIAHRYLSKEQARQEQANRMASKLCEALEIRPRFVIGMNGFCSGYAKALAFVQDRIQPVANLTRREFIIVVTASKISRINDYGCKQSGALFGDFATATLISRMDSFTHTPFYELLGAAYNRMPASRPYFTFHRKQDVPVPDVTGGVHYEDRLVFALDGMGIADTAPRAMAAAAKDLVNQFALQPSDIDHIVPHQAGTGIVRLTGMKLEEAGFEVEPINGLTKSTGNISSSSVPFALHENWEKLTGLIACPVAAVGAPDKPEVSQGCILLRRVPERKSQAA